MLFNSPLARHRPMSTIEFEQQLDYLCQWLDAWTNLERSKIIEVLLPRCDSEQISFLWTVVEPTLHRDFMYSSLNAFPRSSFSPVSIPICREVHKKLGKPRYRTWKLHRLNSTILHDEDEVRQWSAESVLPIVKTPSLPASPTRLFKQPQSLERPLEAKGSWKCLSTYYGVPLPGIHTPSPTPLSRMSCRSSCSKSAPPNLTKSSSQYAVRRHMQDEYKNVISEHHEKSNDHDSHTWKRIYKSKSCPSMQVPIGRKYHKTNRHIRSTSDQGSHVPRLSSIPENAQCVVQWFEEKWNSWQRNQFLQLFLRVLEPAELYLLSGLLAVRQYRDFISLLPEHLAMKILCFLTPRDLLVAAQVSKKWRRMASRDELWQAECKRIYVGIPLRAPTIWKDIFKENLKLKRNWASGKCKVTDMTGHSKNVLSVCQYGDKIASGSLDKSIKIWDSSSGNLIMTLNGHTRGVWSLRFLSTTMLISASYDKSIRVWNLRTTICSRILLGHDAPVWAIERKKDILVSGSGDKTGKLWNIRQCKQLCTLFGHTCSVFCVDLDDHAKTAFTGSADRTVRIWDVFSGACVGIVHAGQSCASAVTAVSFDQGHLAVATGQVISLWNLTTGSCLQELKGHKGRIESIRLRFLMVNGKKESGLIVSAGKDSMIKYWDIEAGTCIQTLSGSKDSVNCIHLDDTRIISCSYDGKVRIWDFNT